MRTLGSIFVVLLVVMASHVVAERETIDRIVAVVGNEVILASELAAQVQMAAFQSGQRPQTEQELTALRDQVLEQMISDHLFLIEAKKDTSISVRPEEVELALDEQVARVAGRFDSDQDFQTALAREGLTVRDLRKRYRSDLENQLTRQRYIQKKLYKVSISKHETEEFYQKYQDSIPNQPEAVKLAHLQITITPSAGVDDSVKQLAMELRKRIQAGADFASISEQYSSLGAGANGGDLGFVTRDAVVPEFARAAFNLNVGEMSGVVRTQFGYHIIKCEDKQTDRSHLRHVLLAVPPSAADSAAALHLADSLITLARNGSDFAELVKVFSTDNDSRPNGGDIGWFSLDQIPPGFADSAKGWKTPGEYRGPVRTPLGLHIIKLLDYQPAKKFTLAEDFDKIKELARQDKTGKLVDKWLAEIKAKTFVEYRLEN